MRFLALTLCLVVAGRAADCRDLIDISHGWRFKLEKGEDGGKNGWSRPDFDDSGWETVDLAGDPARVISGTAGAIWYRKLVERPKAWGRAFLALSGLKGRGELFINGLPVAQALVRPHQGTHQIVREITALAGTGQIQIALKISTENQVGGFDCPKGTAAMLVPDARGLFVDRLGWFDYLAQEYPDLPWPSWARDGGISWFPIFSSTGQRGALMGTSGQLEPEGGDFAVSVWLYYPATKAFYPLEMASGTFALEGRYPPLPLPLFRAKVGKWFQVYVRSWLHSSPDEPSLKFGVGQVTVENTLDRPREIELLMAIHPFGCKFPPHEIEEISFDSQARTISVNGRPAIILAGEPDAFGGTAFSDTAGSVARLVAENRMGVATKIRDPEEKLASAAAVYRLQIQPFGSRTQTFRFILKDEGTQADEDLLAKIRNINWKNSWKDAVDAWRAIMSGSGKTIIRLPDSEAQKAFYASVAYVRMGLTRESLSEEDKMLAAAALLRAGHGDLLAELGMDPAPVWAYSGKTRLSETGSPGAFPRAVGPGYEAMGLFWPGSALTAAWKLLDEDRNEEAASTLAWWLDRQSFPGTFIWAEAVDPVTGKFGGGVIPGLKAAAGVVCLLRDMLLREQGEALMLASGVPADWVDPGRRLQIRHAPTEFGVVPGISVISSPRELTMRMYSFEQLARLERRPTPTGLVVASPPSGYRWKIPGAKPIGRVLVDGRSLAEIPEDRTLELPVNFRSVRVIW